LKSSSIGCSNSKNTMMPVLCDDKFSQCFGRWKIFRIFFRKRSSRIDELWSCCV